MVYLNAYDCFIDDDGNVYLECQHNGWHKKGQLFTVPMHLNPNGYYYVRIHGVNVPLHRLIAEAFIPNPDHLPLVDHVNRNKADNRLSNLRWVSVQTNQRNTNFSDSSFSKYGVHKYEDEKAYKKAWYEAHKGNLKAVA